MGLMVMMDLMLNQNFNNSGKRLNMFDEIDGCYFRNGRRYDDYENNSRNFDFTKYESKKLPIQYKT